MAAVVACVFTFVLASGVLVRGFGDLELGPRGADTWARPLAASQPGPTTANNRGASAAKKLASVESNIANSNADLDQATADMQEASSK